MADLRDKVAVMTGASSGVDRATGLGVELNERVVRANVMYLS